MAIKFSLSGGKPILVPDIKHLVKFANGDLGIADGIKNVNILRNTTQISSPEELEIFKNSVGFGLSNSNDSYFSNGKCKIKPSDVSLDSSTDLSGLKALEKTLIQSTFETQKPYAEVFTQTVGALVRIEDIIARVMSVGGASLKPVNNPKALGYKPSNNKSILNQSLSQVKSLVNKVGATQSNHKENTSNTNINTIGYETISTSYSTGEFDPNVDYQYEYIDIPSDDIRDSDLPDSGVDVLNSDSSEVKPRVIVFGIFDSKGNTINTPPKWLVDSGKWYDQFDMINNYKYVWVNNIFGERRSISSPGKGYKQKVDENGNPIIVFTKNNESDYFKSYYNDIARINMKSLSLTSKGEDNVINEINSRIDYNLQVDALFSSGFLPTINVNGKMPIPKVPFKPKKISYNQKDIWIDPENDYDMKVIRVTPTYKVQFYDSKNALIDGTIDVSSKNPNQIGVFVGKKRIVININQIKNVLSVNTPYSKGYYGSSLDKQTLDEVSRYVTNENDKETYYIVEGILESSNTQPYPTTESLSGNGSSYYKMPKGPISAIGTFNNLLIDVFSKLVPSIDKLSTLISNPASFVVNEAILKKLGDNNGLDNIKFDMFSKKFMQDFSKLESMKPSDRQSFVDKSKIKNYVIVTDDSYKFLLDGTSLTKFLSFTFGIGVNKLVPSLTFKADETNIKNTLNNYLNLSNDEKNKQVSTSQISNTNLKPKLDIPTNQIKTSANGVTTIEEVSIQYSTGVFVEGVNYEYIYLTQYVSDLISSGDKLQISDDPESQNLALAKYEEALKSDPNNKLLLDKINALKDKTGFNTQPLMSFLLNLVTFPLNIIKSIIEFILNFFKSLSNPFKLPTQVVDFISFKWLLDILKPDALIGILGIKFDIGQFNSWVRNIDSYPDDHQFDLNKVMSMPFAGKLFKVDKSGLKELTKSPLSTLSSILCLIESVVNSFIEFIWKLMGLFPILDPPYIKLCKDTNKDVSAKDAMNLLNGNYVDALSSDLVGKDSSYDFVYEIDLPDGRKLRDLNQEELRIWMEENKDMQFEFDF